MSRWTELDLAQKLADNPQLKLSRHNQNSVAYYVVTRLGRGIPSMVHREGCPVLRRATHAKQWNRNPLTEDRFHQFEAHSCLSAAERKTPDNVNLSIPAPVRSQKPGSHQSRDETIPRPEPQAGLNATPQKPGKYRNKPVEVDGHKFPSKREAKRYQELMLMQQAGEIRNLVCQWRYPLEVNRVHVCFYIADFVYTELPSGKQIVEDCKGMRTPVYKLKAKLMFAVYGIKILET